MRASCPKRVDAFRGKSGSSPPGHLPDETGYDRSNDSMGRQDGWLSLRKKGFSVLSLRAIPPAAEWSESRFTVNRACPVKKGIGMFARTFMEHFPLLPVEEEGRLHDPMLRENFIERIFTLKRWRETLAQKENRGNLVNFHTRHKLLILSHSPKHYQIMGKWVAQAKDVPLKELYQKYQILLMEALSSQDHTEEEFECPSTHDGLF